jgi:hypothetical protein
VKIRKRVDFIRNQSAVLGLPLRLTVSLVIGTITLLAILSYILNPCLFPARMLVSVTPYVTILSGSGPENVTFIVYVNTSDGHPLSGASVLIKGLGGAGAGFSDETGTVRIQLQVRLQSGLHEGYLDVSVKAACHEPFEQQDVLKVVKSTL